MTIITKELLLSLIYWEKLIFKQLKLKL